MKLLVILVLIGVVGLYSVSGVFWNSRPKVVRVRLRPPRNQGPVNGLPLHAHHRIHSPSQPQTQPHRNEPIKTRAHPSSSHGSQRFPFQHHNHMPPRPAHFPNSHSNHHNAPVQHHSTVAPEDFFHSRPAFPKHASPMANLVENSGFKSTSDTNQHGYLAPAYNGWKPISKPQFYIKTHQHPTSVKSDYYVYPSTEVYHDQDGKHQKIVLNTLFRDNVKHLKPLKSVKLKPEYSENQAVTIPLPADMGESVRIPSSLFFDRPVHSYYQPFTIDTSESEDKPVIQKPFPKFQARPKPLASEAKRETESSTASPHLSKFKISRPKLRPPVHTQYNNEPEMDGLSHANLPKQTVSGITKSGHGTAGPPREEPINVKPRVTKVRTRVRVKEAKPEGYVNTDELSQFISNRPPAHNSLNSRRPSDTKIPYAHAPAYPSNSQTHNQTLSVAPLDPPYATDFPTFSYPNFMDGFEKQEDGYRTGSGLRETPNPQESGGQKEESGGEKGRVVERKKRPKQHATNNRPSPLVHTQSPASSVYPHDFFMPPVFVQSQSADGQNTNPVSFITMPHSQPQLIHHAPPHAQPSAHNHHQLYPISLTTSPDKTHHDLRSNGNYVQNSPPPFLRDRPHTPSFPPSTYLQPFQHSHQPYQPPYAQGQVQYPTQPSLPPYAPAQPTSPVPFDLIPASTPSSHGRNQYQLSHNHAGRFAPLVPDNQVQNHFHPINGLPSQLNPIFELVETSNANNDPLTAYASNEYEHIPMEFINHLRPILLQQDAHYPNAVASSASNHNTFYPSGNRDPPADYFNNFLRDKDEAPVSHSSSERVQTYMLTQSGEDGGKSGYENYKASSNHQVQVLKPEVGRGKHTFHQIQISNPVISPLHEYSLVTTVSPIHDIDLFSSKSESPNKWSKLKLHSLSSTESYGASSQKHKRLPSNANGTSENEAESRQAATAGPTLASSSITPPNLSPLEAVQKSYLNPSPLLVHNPSPTSGSAEEDWSESNIPNSLRVGATSPPPVFSPQLNPSTTNTRRPFRRRRPGLLARRKFFSSRMTTAPADDPPVTTHRPTRIGFTPTTQRYHPTSTAGFESSRIGYKPRRKALQRKATVESRMGLSPTQEPKPTRFRSSTASSSAQPEHVTYGESQWFRIKESAESDKMNSTKKEKALTAGLDSTQVSFSSRILSTKPHVHLEPLETSSESLLDSTTSKNFYAVDSAIGISAAREDKGMEEERSASSGDLMSL